MSQNASFRRKIIYIVAVVLLLYPLFHLGQPATQTSPGGQLAQLRSQYGIAQANLGEIDPASETMKLATLGMRGVASNILWAKAHEYKRTKDWDNLQATVNQMIRLQPNFVGVWEFQSHNLAYNVSVEFDNYQHRYHWVKKGINFATEGTRYNVDNPRLLHQTGWIVAQKIGRADEHVQFRELFREDVDFHNDLQNQYIDMDRATGYDGRPDNWLVGYLIFRDSQAAIDQKGKRLIEKSPLIFHRDAAMSKINYAGAIEDEGILDEKAQNAWYEGGEVWKIYGRRPIPTSWGHNIQLGSIDALNDEIKRTSAQLDALVPGAREAVKQEKIAALTDDERATLKYTEQEAYSKQDIYSLYLSTQQKINVTNNEVAEHAPENIRPKAKRIAARLNEAEVLALRVNRYRDTVNFGYWETRCNVEQTKTAVDARRLLYQATQYHRDVDLENAKRCYEESWQLWRKVFEMYPTMMDDVTAEELVKSVERYYKLKQQLDEKIPEDFVLREFMERQEDDMARFYGKPNEASQTPTEDKPTEDKPTEDKPTEDKPTEDKPTEDKPTEDKPAEDKPAEDKPAEDKPAEDKPAEDKPAEDKPTEDKPTEDKPTEDKPAEEKPAEEKPIEEKPIEDKPTEDKPAE